MAAATVGKACLAHFRKLLAARPPPSRVSSLPPLLDAHAAEDCDDATLNDDAPLIADEARPGDVELQTLSPLHDEYGEAHGDDLV